MIAAARRKTFQFVAALFLITTMGAAPTIGEEVKLKTADELVRLMQANPKQWDDSLRLMPVMATRPLEAPNRIVFIWGRDCPPCAEAFRTSIWSIMTDESKHRKVMILMIQYETKPAKVHQIVDLVCASPDKYAWSSMNYLLSRTNKGKEIEFPPALDGSTGNMKSELCTSKQIAREHVRAFMKEIGKGYKVGALPIVLLNGKQLGPPYKEIGTVQ